MQPKLILFDIDGTLLNAHGIPRISMRRVLLDRFGNNFNYHDDYNFTGRTDWEIVEHLLEYAKVKIEITTGLVHDILDEFGVELENELRINTPPQLHKGILELITYLDVNDDSYLGLVTGNIAAGARAKLRSSGLDQYFPVGSYGDDAKERNKLPKLAIHRAEDYYHIKVAKDNVWIIGDSVPDIICARVNKLKCLIVCTGWTNRSELEAEYPDVILEDLSNTEEVLDLLLS